MPLRLRLAVLNAIVLTTAILLLSGIAYAQLANSLKEWGDCCKERGREFLGEPSSVVGRRKFAIEIAESVCESRSADRQIDPSFN